MCGGYYIIYSSKMYAVLLSNCKCVTFLFSFTFLIIPYRLEIQFTNLSLPGFEDIGPEIIAIFLCPSLIRALIASNEPDVLLTKTELK